MVITMVNSEEDKEEDLEKDLGEVVSEELVSNVVKKGIEPMNVYNTKEGQTEKIKTMQKLHMQMKKLSLNILIMLKGEKP